MASGFTFDYTNLFGEGKVTAAELPDAKAAHKAVCHMRETGEVRGHLSKDGTPELVLFPQLPYVKEGNLNSPADIEKLKKFGENVTFTVSNLLTLGKERLSGRVSVEDVPSGQIFLTSIMQAMEDGRELEIEYGKYNSPQTDTLHIQPFAVKEHERRWYLVAFCHERAERDGKETGNGDMSAWRVYGLDRIVTLKEMDKTFKMPRGFDVDALFHDSFGIFFPKEGQKSETVRLRATDEEARYLRDLPLHRSQKEEGPAEGGGRIFRLRLIPVENLLMEFCRLAGRVEVLEPESVRSAVREMLEKGLNNYK